ncbi:hypothetical protein TNCT_545261 [Trichonephila clavata]|uniref:Uncharacterized protein n=1 Tax=Trichonephila clavata TaxID=2740835 RepID=A0A8X6L0L6_TRICU|nr:hypothetical protein TNCT_545261 [Trichonephila clavata]
MTPTEDRYIVLSPKRDQCTTANQVADESVATTVLDLIVDDNLSGPKPLASTIMVRTGTKINGRSPLHVLETETMTNQQALLPHVHLFRGVHGR